MRYLHTMLRVSNLDRALDFFCTKLGLVESRRIVDEKGRFTLVFLVAPDDKEKVAESLRVGRDTPTVELTWNWDEKDCGEARYFGHLAYEVDDIYALCERLMQAGLPAETTVAVIENASRLDKRLLHGVLRELPGLEARDDLGGPVMVIIGDAVAGANFTHSEPLAVRRPAAAVRLQVSGA